MLNFLLKLYQSNVKKDN